MLLRDYCLPELYQYCGLKYEPEGGIPDAVVTSSQRYQSFRDKLNTQLTDWHPSVAEFLYVLLPAAYSAATTQQGNAQTDAEIDEYFSGYEQYLAPLSLLRPALDILERKFFRQVEHIPPSLELGVGDGYASKFIFHDKLTVGSDPLLFALQNAKQLGGHENYVSLDMTRIPYQAETFNTVYLVHTIDHIADRLDALREVARVLRPGGRVVLTDMAADDEKLLPLAHVFQQIGLSEVGRDTFNFFLDIVGERRMSPRADYYYDHLRNLGFDDIRVELFMSPQLTRMVYLQMELQFLLGYHEDQFRENAKLRQTYFTLGKQFLSPLIAADEQLCRSAGEGMNLFVTAQKRGQETRSSLNLLDRLICPECGTQLKHYCCDSCGREYPVIEGIPLLIPFYADHVRQIEQQLSCKIDQLPAGSSWRKTIRETVPGLVPLVRAVRRRLR